MRFILGLLTILVVTGPSPLAGQTWRELYDRGEYGTAAASLHPLVLDAEMPDADAAEALGRLYWEGKGVLPDKVIACSFFNLASAAAAFKPFDPNDSAPARLERLQSATCDTLSAEDRLEARQMIGCPKYGPDRQLFSLEDGHSVELTRRGFRIDGDGTQQPDPLPTVCLERIALVRHTRVDPATQAEGAKPRHFIELYSWMPAPTTGQRALYWKLAEVVGRKIEWREMREIAQESGPTWTPREVAFDKTDVRFDASSTGRIQWHFGRDGIDGSLEPLPEPPDVLANPAPLPTTGKAHISVTTVDRFGDPLEGATVTLTGVVSREATSNEAGFATFEALPEGRYDLIASAKPLAPSAPRVLDLSGSGGETVRLTLKPYGPGGMTLACGGFDPNSIKTLAAGAFAVLHVKVTGQSTSERQSSADGSSEGLMTSNKAQTLRVFKGGAFVPLLGSVMTIEQGGGRLDRGDDIAYHQFNRLGPLNVGDEYVLFLYPDATGTYTIYGAEEGAFRIRNGRVESLGGGGAAKAWAGRSAARFFEALQVVSRD